MALHMSWVRMAPDAPTRVPAMRSAKLPSTKPVAATAMPVYEFSSDTTTGMSAPPIGITSWTPSTSDRSTNSRKSGTLAETTAT